ncbi:hypothetical protein N7493_007429 [Penicillium malachiteum]|uniref:Glycosylphosphatidylinositol anchor biosynthesis protein 11 n=1 Tax=Penicillium malachiteum TaxID=1324776 RepID=A0AAD6MU75_9EURO|nr:hypothetical protein N7493_007429 [Penicillium malachiteum]
MASPSTFISAVNPPSAPSQPPVEKPSPPPVNILPSQLAQTYSYVHPTILLTLGATRFNALVEDPVSELLNDLPWLALLQLSYVILCLPPAGSLASDSSSNEKSQRSTSGITRPGKGPRRKHSGKNEWAGIWARLMPAFLSVALTFLIATPVIAVLLVLFAHMALLSSSGLTYVHGIDASLWKEVWGFARPADAVWGGAFGTVLGAWFGAIPIPLDWDRPWQAFPITILAGAYMGYVVGTLVSRTPLLYGKRIQFTPGQDEEEEKTN